MVLGTSWQRQASVVPQTIRLPQSPSLHAAKSAPATRAICSGRSRLAPSQRWHYFQHTSVPSRLGAVGSHEAEQVMYCHHTQVGSSVMPKHSEHNCNMCFHQAALLHFLYLSWVLWSSRPACEECQIGACVKCAQTGKLKPHTRLCLVKQIQLDSTLQNTRRLNQRSVFAIASTMSRINL